ncbi:related to putative protein [Fusarium fujikuroi]|nr:related to putative protein [Fusarium fujikuroi]SCO48093.1 related to putative protein [Fusarium fujikuroi]
MSSINKPEPAAQTFKAQKQPFEQMQMEQPKAHQSMSMIIPKPNPTQPHPDTQVSMRGGDRGGPCPGRFCFCIPCPLPCDCCFIPL